MVNTHIGMNGRRRPKSKANSAKRRAHTHEILSKLNNGLNDMKKDSAKKASK